MIFVAGFKQFCSKANSNVNMVNFWHENSCGRTRFPTFFLVLTLTFMYFENFPCVKFSCLSLLAGSIYPTSSHDILLSILDFRLSLRKENVIFCRKIDIKRFGSLMCLILARFCIPAGLHSLSREASSQGQVTWHVLLIHEF